MSASTELTPGRDAERPAAVPLPVTNRRGGSVLIVDFHRDGNSAPYRVDGWSAQEQSYVWSVGATSVMRLPPLAEVTALVLDLQVSVARTGGILGAAVLRVFVNGVAVGNAYLQGFTRLRCAVPASLLRANEPVELRFEHPCFVRMDFLQDSRDTRPLGLCFYGLMLYPPWLGAAAGLAAPLPQDSKSLVASAPVPPASGMIDPVEYRFDNDAPGRAFLRDGWCFDAAGDARAGERHVSLELPSPGGAVPLIARFDICPMFIRNVLQRQRVTIILSGAVIGQFRTGSETSVSIMLPPELVRPGQPLRFTFGLPDGIPMHSFGVSQPRQFLSIVLDRITISAVPPRHPALAQLRDDDALPMPPMARSDRFLDEPIEALPAAVLAATGSGLPEILRYFESLGDNCSFGLAQGKGGCDVMGLLRFANTPLNRLMAALDDEFRAIADKSQITMRWVPSAPGEFVLLADRYGIRWHTNVSDEAADQPALFAQQAMRLSYLRRKFYEGLSAGRKIMAVSRAEPKKHPIPMPYAAEPDYWEEKPEPLRLGEVLPLFLKLNEYGRNTLLYLTRCERGRRPGTVELLAPGIMRGYVDDFVISNDPAIVDHATWMRIAVNAWLLDQGPNASFRRRTDP